MENKISHLKIIVDLLDMVNRSDVYAKRWAVSFAAVFLALATQIPGIRVAYLALLPMLLVWYIDAQNHRREYLLRKLYDRVRTLPEEHVDFSIDIEALPDAQRNALIWMASPSVLAFYGAMIVGVIIVDCFIV